MTYDLYLKNEVGGFDFDPDYVDYIIDKYAKREINVLISSLGGQVHSALKINDAFRRHGNVHVHFTGMNASAATIASLGAKTITIDPSALYLIHRCSMPVMEWDMFNADQMRTKIEELQKAVDNLDTIDYTIAKMYANRAGDDHIDHLLELMAKGNWLTADDVLELHLVDAVGTIESPAPAADSAQENIIAMLEYANLPVPKQINNSMYYTFDLLGDCISAERHELAFADNHTALSIDEVRSIENRLHTDQQTITDLHAALDTSRAQVETLQAKIDEQNDTIDAAAVLSADQQAEIKALQAKIDELQARIDALPAEDTDQVINNQDAPAADMYQTIKAAQELYNSLP